MVTQMVWLALSILFLSGLYSFALNKSHLLNSLLSLEFLGAGVYLFMSLKFNLVSGEVFYSLFYLVMIVSESVLGLSLLIGLCWGYGEDFMKSMSISVC